MNRREFVTGLGTLAAAGSAQALHGPDVRGVISGGFGQNVNPVGITQMDQTAPGAVMTLGYIPGSAGFVNTRLPSEELSVRDRWGLTNVRAAVSILGYFPSASPTIERVDVTVNFAIAEAPYFAPFYAWQYVNVAGQPVKSSAPLTFRTNVPEAASIGVSFRVRSPASGAVASGSLLYSVGGSGLGPGIYALAGPSPAMGGAPDWNQITWGDKAGSLARRDGRAVDFDYITFVLAPTHVV